MEATPDTPDPAEELRRENARLARDRLGVSGTAAATGLQRLCDRLDALERDLAETEALRAHDREASGRATDALRADVVAELTDLRASLVALGERLDRVAVHGDEAAGRIEREAFARHEELVAEIERRDGERRAAEVAGLEAELARQRAAIAAMEASVAWRAQQRLSGLRTFLLGRRR